MLLRPMLLSSIFKEERNFLPNIVHAQKIWQVAAKATLNFGMKLNIVYYYYFGRTKNLILFFSFCFAFFFHF